MEDWNQQPNLLRILALVLSKWNIRFGCEREGNIVLLGTEGTYWMPVYESTVYESPPLASGGKKHC